MDVHVIFLTGVIFIFPVVFVTMPIHLIIAAK
jgi:hypothetical protein